MNRRKFLQISGIFSSYALAGSLQTILHASRTSLTNKYLSKEVSKKIDLKFSPKLVFRYDESFEKVNAIEELVRNIDMQRQFEINVKLIKKASDLDSAGAKLMGLPS